MEIISALAVATALGFGAGVVVGWRWLARSSKAKAVSEALDGRD